MKVVEAPNISATMLCRHRDSEEYDTQISYPRSALLVCVQVMRSAAFVASRAASRGPSDGLDCGQLPASRCLSLVQPAGPLVVRDAMLCGEIQGRFNDADQPEDRWVRLSLNAAAQAMGYRGSGGNQRRSARQALERLAATTLHWREAHEDSILSLTWRPLEAVHMSGDGLDEGYVRLSQTSADLVSDGYLHYLNPGLCRALVAADEIAARLWMMLECERLAEKPHFYSVFRSPAGEARKHSDAIFISEVTGLDRRANRRDVAHRLGEALVVIERLDAGRYELSLRHGAAAGMYTLQVRRHRRERPRRNAARAGRPDTTEGVAQATPVGSASDKGEYGEQPSPGTTGNASFARFLHATNRGGLIP